MANGTNVGNAYLQIVPTSQGIQGGITKLLNKDAGTAGTESGGILGKMMGSKAVKALAAMGVGTAIAGVVKSAIGEGSELEQNIGGLSAVFGEFATEVQGKANEAYKSMGLSASDYMATVNKMGSLFQGSGLEQERAMELSTSAMERAADVASVMGLDTTMAMESIAGAAKGNFTMMDNLGVAMNATTIAAYALEKGINFDWNTASNAEKAEVAMQMFMDRTQQYAGNFAREASETFSGSLSAMQASWKNVLGNMALGESIQGPLTALGETASAFLFNNLIPMVLNAVSSLPGALLQVGGTAINMLLSNLPSVAGQLIGAIGTMLGDIGTGIVPFLMQVIDGFVNMFINAKDLVSNIDWIALGQSIIEKIKTIWTQLSTQLPQKLKTIGTTALQWVQSIDWIGLGRKVITFIGNGITALMNNLPTLLKTIATTGLTWVQSVDWQGLGRKVVNFIVSGVKFLATNLPTALKTIATTGLNWVKSINWVALGKSVINLIVSGIKALVTSIPNVLKGIGSSAITAFKNINWGQLGSSIINGIISGIRNAASSLFGSLRDLASDALGAAKKALGINSPSKVFAKVVGRAIPEGIAYGIDKYAYMADDALLNLENDLVGGIDMASMIGTPNSELGQAINSGASENNYVIEVAANIDGTELKTQVSNYTIRRIGNEQRNQLRAQGV